MDVIVSKPVDVMIQWLDEEDRSQVMSCLQRLQHWRDNGVLHEDVRRLSPKQDLYVFRATDSLRVIFRDSKDFLEVVDLVRQERLADMFGHPSAEV